MEELEAEYFRLLSIAEGYTGYERLKLSANLEEKIARLQRFIDEENAMRDLTPYTIEDMRKRIEKAIEKDDYYDRLQRESKDDQGGH